MNKLSAEELRNALVVSSMEYCKQYLQEAESVDADKIKAIKIELDNLEAYGLGNSRNATELRTLYQQLNKTARKGTTWNLNRKFFEEIKYLAPSVLIVPYDDFFEILNTYGLACGPLGCYNGIIPEENVAEIMTVGEQLKGFTNLNTMRWVNTVTLDSDIPKNVQKEVIQYFSIFPYVKQSIQDGWDYMRSINRGEYSSALHLSISHIKAEDWQIAAPFNEMKDNVTIKLYSGAAERRRQAAEDPIVFKVNDLGVIIASMWGKEASSSIFDKYR